MILQLNVIYHQVLKTTLSNFFNHIETNSIGEVFPGSMLELRSLMYKNGFKLFQKTSIVELSFLYESK